MNWGQTIQKNNWKREILFADSASAETAAAVEPVLSGIQRICLV